MTVKPTAYELFRAGHDIFEIARILRITEAEAVKSIDLERARRKQWKAEHTRAPPRHRKRLIMFNDLGQPVYE